MLRSNSVRNTSLAALDTASRKPTKPVEKDGVKTIDDSFAQTSASEKLLSAPQHKTAGNALQSPVDRGMQGASSVLARCLTPKKFDMLGHNGVVLDPDHPESIHMYLNATRRILDSQSQVAPQDELGRMHEVALFCRKRANKFAGLRDEYSVTDRAHLDEMTARTASVMADEAVRAEGDACPADQVATRKMEHAARLLPEAYNMVHERSRGAQASKHAAAWHKFYAKIVEFCCVEVSHIYPECISDEKLTAEKDLRHTDPKEAHNAATTRALYRKWKTLADNVFKMGNNS